MSASLTPAELTLLVKRVFQPTDRDRGIAVIVDVPDDRLPDNPDWAERRRLAAEWSRSLAAAGQGLGLSPVTLAWYPNVGGNNADLPAMCFPAAGFGVVDRAADLAGLPEAPFTRLFQDHSIVLAPTELSATAPLKVATAGAGTGPDGFRAATMPGFLPGMIPALKLDYGEINRRVDVLKSWLDAADHARFRFRAAGLVHELTLDLRHRRGHASGGLFPANGVAGNLPSGEAYIVPYEGERVGDPSRSAGTLPVQIDGEIVLYEIEDNRAVSVLSEGPVSAHEARLIQDEPAYANLAELGLGVLGDFGLEPCGSILLDEKLGLHIAFGRSDHFGGTVGPQHFSGPGAVIHLDRVFIPQTQPDVAVEEVTLGNGSGERVVIREGEFTPIA
ncbi:hypothetical protein KJ682_08650 [bacterium]|nr:hypothetical protein [bacterium]